MARPGVTRKQVFDTADALVLEGQNPTVLRIRERLGGGSPNTINPLLGEWRAQQERDQAPSQPPVPETVESMLRQVWGAAWKEAQGQLSAEREVLEQARQAAAQERQDWEREIERMDKALNASHRAEERCQSQLEALRQELAGVQADAREAQALAQERQDWLQKRETELASANQARIEAEHAAQALTLEVATLTERCTRMEEWRGASSRR
jgi:DNA repair exonuclease SbcCD ATPase subunit